LPSCLFCSNKTAQPVVGEKIAYPNKSVNTGGESVKKFEFPHFSLKLNGLEKSLKNKRFAPYCLGISAPSVENFFALIVRILGIFSQKPANFGI